MSQYDAFTCYELHPSSPHSESFENMTWDDAVEGRQRTSGLYLPGSALDSQTTESQFIAEIHRGAEDALPDRGSTHESSEHGGGSGTPSNNAVEHAQTAEMPEASILQELAHVKVQLANTRRQLYEYVGRWVLAEAQVGELKSERAAIAIANGSLSTSGTKRARAHSDVRARGLDSEQADVRGRRSGMESNKRHKA
ncbi:hypothetical protein C8Q79DRAFT_929254 [Trametes meyenii]|nr:hypothetical protein C8Q79DRAFT_929254 [Trametes meyenii]